MRLRRGSRRHLAIDRESSRHIRIAHRRPARPVADRRAAPGARPDVPDRLAGRAAFRRTSRPSNRGPRFLTGSRRRHGDGARRPALAGARLGRRARPGRAVGPVHSIRRSSLYDEVLDRLKASESVYPCTCTRADIERAASAPHAEDEGPTYPGTCAHRSVADALTLGDRPFAWRFRVPPGPVAWNDLFLGRVELDPSRLGGDFIVARHGVGHSYQLAVVADDRAMGVNQVIRGADLVPSTPRQILLYRRLGWAASDLRPRRAGRRPRRPPPGQARRLAQAYRPFAKPASIRAGWSAR